MLQLEVLESMARVHLYVKYPNQCFLDDIILKFLLSLADLTHPFSVLTITQQFN